MMIIERQNEFIKNIYFQFDCVNTLNDQLLENVQVELSIPEGFKVVGLIPCAKLPYGEKESTYAIVEFPEDVGSSIGKVSNLNPSCLWGAFYLQ